MAFVLNRTKGSLAVVALGKKTVVHALRLIDEFA